VKPILLFIISVITAPMLKAQLPSHPRLFFSSSDTLTLRNRATTQTTPPTKAYELWTQIIRDKEANYFAFGTQGINGPSNKELIIKDAWQMENFYSIALAYTITNDVSYLNAARDILFGVYVVK